MASKILITNPAQTLLLWSENVEGFELQHGAVYTRIRRRMALLLDEWNGFICEASM